jgi:hypothetical protein
MAKQNSRAGDVLSIELRDNLFTLAQVPISPYFMFFNIASNDGAWKNIDLDTVEPLFSVPVATARMKPLIAGAADVTMVKPRSKPMSKLYIKPNLNMAGGHPFRGGNLIEIDDRGETTGRPIIKRLLSVENDADTIRQYELTNMWVDPEEIRQRLIRYFDTGIDWDLHKEKVFPGITPPPPVRRVGS